MKNIITTLLTLFVLTNNLYAQESATKEIKDAIASNFKEWLIKSDFETNVEYENRVKTKSEEELKKISEETTVRIKNSHLILLSEKTEIDRYNVENESFRIYNEYLPETEFFIKIDKKNAKSFYNNFQYSRCNIIKGLDITIINDKWTLTKINFYFSHGGYCDWNQKYRKIIKIDNTVDFNEGSIIYLYEWDITQQPNYSPSISKPIAFSLEDLNITLPATLTSSSSNAVTKSEEPDLESKMIQTTNRNPNAVAVVIGNKEYENTKKVSYATNDAAEVKNYLIKALGYSESNIIYLENAKKSNFDILFGTNDNPEGKLFNSIKQGESDVFIYYSGHGAPGLKDNKGYIVPVDCDPNYLEQTGYSLDLFYKNLAKLNAKSVTVVTDACFSGAELFKNISPITITVSNPIVLMPNCVVLSSSTGSQVSSWFNEKNHGLFTYFFLRAFQEKEKVDADKNNTITFKELASYIADKTQGVPSLARKLHNVDQNPTIQGTGVENVFISY